MEDFSSDKILELWNVILPYLIDAGIAVIILLVGMRIANLVKSGVSTSLTKASWMDNTLVPVAASTAKYAIYIIIIIAVLGQFGVNTNSIVALLGAAGIAVGLALKDTLGNVAAGVMLLFLRPFTLGDFIEAGGVSGSVERIELFTVTLKTAGGVYVSVPNSQIASSAVTNYSRNMTRRVDVVLGISYDDDLEVAIELLEGFIKSDDRVLKDPEPMVMVVALADSSVNINLRVWVNTPDYWAVVFHFNRAGKNLLEDNGFEIPFPQRTVHMVHSNAEQDAPKAVN